MITKDNWRKYIEKLAAIDDRAADLMRAYINENGLEDEAALINYAYALTSKYGDASATLSCEMYDYMAEMMDADVPEAIPAATATYKEVASGTMWAKYHSPSQISSIVGRQVRQAGADTMMQNAKRDKAEWAWVPQGDTCAFCITLASRGWQEASKTVLRGNHAEHIHQNCDCTFAIAFKEKDKRQYDYIYDPERYMQMYEESGGDINAIRRRIYDANKDEINAQRRDAYQAKTLQFKKPGSFNDPDVLDKHYKKHQNEFEEEISKEEYLRRAYEIAERPLSETVEEIKRSDGSISKYDKETNEFVVINPDKSIRSYFIPEYGEKYWEEEYERNRTK